RIVDDLAQARARKISEGPTPDAVAEEWRREEARISSEYSERFRAAVHRTLSADLATWPRAFRESLRERVITFDLIFGSPDWQWQQFRNRREDGTSGEAVVNGCGCGCRGFNGALAREIGFYRKAAGEVTTARKPHLKERRREALREKRAELLRLLWWHGVR